MLTLFLGFMCGERFLGKFASCRTKLMRTSDVRSTEVNLKANSVTPFVTCFVVKKPKEVC
jgi:hypothetical protein